MMLFTYGIGIAVATGVQAGRGKEVNWSNAFECIIWPFLLGECIGRMSR